MASLSHPQEQTTKWFRYSARTLGLLWTGWWTFFGLASGLGEGLDPVGVVVHTTMPGLIFLVTVIVAWRWEAIGSILLILEGVLVALAYPVMTSGRMPVATIVFVLLTMALPPLVSGVLWLASWRRSLRQLA